MSRRISTAVLAMLSSVAFAGEPAASSPAGRQMGEEAAVLGAMASMQMPDGMTYRARSVAAGGCFGDSSCRQSDTAEFRQTVVMTVKELARILNLAQST